jgi:hypothetical protein
MGTTIKEINDFARFARAHLEASDESLSIDELFDRWREQCPSVEDTLAVRASIRDMENGESGRPLDEFSDEFRKRNEASETS